MNDELFIILGIMSKNVWHCSVPMYDGLAIKDIMSFVEINHKEVLDYLPIPQELHKVSKEWICNIVATILGGHFVNWVKTRIEERNERVAVKKDLMIHLDAEVAEAFRASTKTSLVSIIICYYF